MEDLFILEVSLNCFKHKMFTVNELIQAFDNKLTFAWELLHAEIMMETSLVNTDHLRSLIILYSKAIQKFHTSRLPNSNYFKHKINHLMGQKQVINCLTSEQKQLTSGKKQQNQKELSSIEVPTLPSMNIERDLQARKQDLELRLAYGVEESKNIQVKEIIKMQALKVEKVKQLVKSCLTEEEERLRSKIARRQRRATEAKKLRESVQWSVMSTQLQTEGGCCNFSLNDISFISDVDSDL